MKKKLIILSALGLCLCGCGGQSPTLSDGSQAVVSFEDESLSVSASELYDAMKEQYALNSLLELMDLKLLEKELPDALEDTKKEAEETADSMKESYGIDQINSYFGSMERYTNYLYVTSLQQKAILEYVKGKLSDKEIQSYYDKNIYPDVVVDHILIQTGVTDDTSDDEKTKLENEAQNKAKEVIEKLNQAEDKLATFKELAKEYSDDEATKDNGGSLGAINTDTLSSSYDELLEAARKLNDGTYSTDIITTELGYHVIYKESTSEKASLDSVKDTIKEELANTKLNEDSTLSITALQELRKKYGMEIQDSKVKEQYENYIANAIATARNNDSAN